MIAVALWFAVLLAVWLAAISVVLHLNHDCSLEHDLLALPLDDHHPDALPIAYQPLYQRTSTQR